MSHFFSHLIFPCYNWECDCNKAICLLLFLPERIVKDSETGYRMWAILLYNLLNFGIIRCPLSERWRKRKPSIVSITVVMIMLTKLFKKHFTQLFSKYFIKTKFTVKCRRNYNQQNQLRDFSLKNNARENYITLTSFLSIIYNIQYESTHVIETLSKATEKLKSLTRWLKFVFIERRHIFQKDERNYLEASTCDSWFTFKHV